MKIGNDLANSNRFVTFNKHTFKKGDKIVYNDRQVVVISVHDKKNGKYVISIKDDV